MDPELILDEMPEVDTALSELATTWVLVAKSMVELDPYVVNDRWIVT